MLTYEMRIWAPYSMDGESEGSALFGDRGYIIVGNRRWRAFTNGGPYGALKFVAIVLKCPMCRTSSIAFARAVAPIAIWKRWDILLQFFAMRVISLRVSVAK